ncbi:MAG: KpsF/GutQ family sugar-phosphate isomerase [Pseudomonadota bacterium]|nr:KpsF/GutQ family sugar-phosphate isomerase [Pseudomonadota bacterium]
MADDRRPVTPAEADNGDLAVARRVLQLEAAALGDLARALDQRFVAAVDCLLQVRGRVIMTGMGKSGHVARKIAATMASTGTPAYFVHPAEASHGDLGMITRNDALVCLSNSGETHELGDIVEFARRNAVPMIAMVGRVPSTLGSAADICLVTPPAPEACPNGLAPTTSTTMMLALGDALAVALLERRKFTAEDFGRLHPGGKLGRQLVRVRDIMHSGESLPLVPSGTTVADALLVMTGKSFGCVGVLKAGRLAGIVTDGDLRRALRVHGDPLHRSVDDIMTVEPRTIRPDALASEGLGQMNERRITSLFVIDDGAPVGLLHVHDCLRAGLA